jgi:hypothetical protein
MVLEYLVLATVVPHGVVNTYGMVYHVVLLPWYSPGTANNGTG